MISFFIFIIDIDEINGAEQNFTANVVLRLQWKDKRLAKDTKAMRMMPMEEVWNPRILLANRQTLTRTSLPEVVEVTPDGTVNYRQRYVGPLSQPLRLSQFPFDRHDFVVQFVAAGFDSERREALRPGARRCHVTEEVGMPLWVVDPNVMR